MYFSKEDVEAGLMTKLIEYLCNYSYQCWSRDFALYNDIHIKPDDCDAFVVEWEQRPWSGEYGGHFEFVGEEQVVCNEVEFPDKHFEYTPEDPDESIKEWLVDNPGWYKDECGHWQYSDQIDDFLKDIFGPQFGPQKPEDKMNQWLDENDGWHEDSEGNWANKNEV
jgi:hypothetical protein